MDYIENAHEAGFGITAITRLKHADLYAAAKKLGSQTALASYLGVRESELGLWVNLKACPPHEPNTHLYSGSRWDDVFFATAEAKLYELTGKTWDELWPDSLRDNIHRIAGSTLLEQTRRVDPYLLEHYASKTRDRLIECQSPDQASAEDIEDLMVTLNEKEKRVIMARFGLDGIPKTLREVGKEIGVAVERARQIESKAIKKMQAYAEENGLKARFLKTCLS